ncbi:protein kinase [Alkaliphilus metalliredigens QYMF]|uniref:Protein kinase n=1 Tax=Alkaliphilus metalliredigens (strain QYMF) TaxID=293826 RepID=A6TWP9_ALKMQ|nr:protein kinase [Alkaliphilus metalliredigens QYMF]
MLQLHKGQRLEGKWQKNRYRVIHKLGQGALGAVYLVESEEDQKKYAMKVSEDNLSLNREYQLMVRFSKEGMVAEAIEIDDLELDKKRVHFIILEYIAGKNLKTYTENTGIDYLMALKLMRLLIKGTIVFGEKGYILGDLKPENIMIDENKKEIRFIDLGGVVNIGGGIKEFTPLYDQASWGIGERKATEAYLCFSLTMILVQLLIGQKLNPRNHNIQAVNKKIAGTKLSIAYRTFLNHGLKGKYTYLKDFANEVEGLYGHEKKVKQFEKMNCSQKWVDYIFIGSLSFFILTIFLILINQ